MDVVWSDIASDEDESLNDDTCLPTGYNLDSLDDKDDADSNDGITTNTGVPAPAILEEGLRMLGFDSARQERAQLQKNGMVPVWFWGRSNHCEEDHRPAQQR